MEFIQPLHLKNAFYGKHNANKFWNHTIIYFVLISQTDIGMHYKSLLRNNHVHFQLNIYSRIWCGPVISNFTVFRLLTDFVYLYTCEFWLSLCKIVRSSVILLLPYRKTVKFEITGPHQILEYIFYIYLNKNWKIYLSEQSFTRLNPEYRCSLWWTVLKSVFEFWEN
jgi:hypothetical protein